MVTLVVMDDRALRRAAVLADLERAFRRRKLRRLHADPVSIPAIVNTAMLAAVNQARREAPGMRPAR